MRLLLLLVAATLAACQSNPFSDGPPRNLQERVKTFEDIVRWRELDKMYAFVKPGPGMPSEVQPGLDNVRVTSYESSPLRPLGKDRWAMTAVIDYVLLDSQIVRQLVDQQVWESEDGKNWYRASPIPLFR
jgi:hypothetical protein